MYLPGPGFAIGLKAGGVLGRAQQPAAVERVGHRARAVIAGRLEGAVAAAPHIRPRRDFIGGRDHARDGAFDRVVARESRACGRSLEPLAAGGSRLRPVRHRLRGTRRLRDRGGGGLSVLSSLTPITPTSRGRPRRRRSSRGVPAAGGRRLGFRTEFAVHGEMQGGLQTLHRAGSARGRFGARSARRAGCHGASSRIRRLRLRLGWGRADGGGVSVACPCTPITPQVAGPTTPSTLGHDGPAAGGSAASVSGPKSPSAVTCRALCSCATALRAALFRGARSGFLVGWSAGAEGSASLAPV